MARPRNIEENDLIDGLARVFGEMGFEGASLSKLAQATGLQRASLYHRFPGGKQQMAEEVLATTGAWLEAKVLSILQGPGTPKARIAEVAANLDGFYQGGAKACLLNMLSSPRTADGPFAPAIKAAFAALIGGLAALAEETGVPNPRERAERAVMLLQGALVLSRGTGDTAPFRAVVAGLPAELLEAPR